MIFKREKKNDFFKTVVKYLTNNSFCDFCQNFIINIAKNCQKCVKILLKKCQKFLTIYKKIAKNLPNIC